MLQGKVEQERTYEKCHWTQPWICTSEDIRSQTCAVARQVHHPLVAVRTERAELTTVRRY